MKKLSVLILSFILFSISASEALTRQMEYLNRSAIAVKITGGVYLGWRWLGTDNPSTGFNIYRDNILINSSPITTSTNYTDASGTTASVYKILPVLNGVEDTSAVKPFGVWAQAYKTIQLNRPASGITPPNKYGSVGTTATATFPNGQPYGYSPNDCSVGDVDGDGEYEIIVKWDPSNSQDNSLYGITGKVYIDAYKMDGTMLWRIDLGKNIRAGAHYTQFLVYDFDGDGLAELICKTAPGTVDGRGKNVIMNSDDPNADYRNLDITQTSGSKMLGTIQTGPEYLSLFDGKTGDELNTIAYNPARGSVSGWGDSYANRCDRFLACVVYLDGIHPSAVMCRGYYTRATLASYDVKDKKLAARWFYDSGNSSGVGAYGQGNHNLSVADVDNDGKDEIVYSSCAIDDNGTCMYRTGLGHGDAMHVSDLDPDHAGLEVYTVHEETTAKYGYELHDAKTGTVLWGLKTASDNGRGLAADIDARYRGFELWSIFNNTTYTCKGDSIAPKRSPINFRIYWDGDLQDELLDGTSISKWNGNGTTTLLSASGVSSCNSTKKTPCLTADLFGDWREEVILWTTADSSKLQIYTTTTPTNYRLYTPMHDAVYRLGVAWQNAAYNQPPHLGFYIGDGLTGLSQPDITTVKYDAGISGLSNPLNHPAVLSCLNGSVLINSSEMIHTVEAYTVSGMLIFQNNHVQNQYFSFNLPQKNNLYLVKVKTNAGTQVAKMVN
ncbi:MAG: rhamnogalacturonan lyase [Paludibacter sp.]